MNSSNVSVKNNNNTAGKSKLKVGMLNKRRLSIGSAPRNLKRTCKAAVSPIAGSAAGTAQVIENAAQIPSTKTEASEVNTADAILQIPINNTVNNNVEETEQQNIELQRESNACLPTAAADTAPATVPVPAAISCCRLPGDYTIADMCDVLTTENNSTLSNSTNQCIDGNINAYPLMPVGSQSQTNYSLSEKASPTIDLTDNNNLSAVAVTNAAQVTADDIHSLIFNDLQDETRLYQELLEIDFSNMATNSGRKSCRTIVLLQELLNCRLAKQKRAEENFEFEKIKFEFQKEFALRELALKEKQMDINKEIKEKEITSKERIAMLEIKFKYAKK